MPRKKTDPEPPPPEVLAVWDQVEGWDHKRIGAVLGWSERTLRRLYADPLVAAARKAAAAKGSTATTATGAAFRARARELAQTAADVLEEILLDGKQPGGLRRMVAHDLLDAAGAKRPEPAPPPPVPTSREEEAAERWRRAAAALEANAGNAAATAALLGQQREAYQDLIAIQGTGVVLTAEEAAEALSVTVAGAPRAVEYRLLREILERHPDWGSVG